MPGLRAHGMDNVSIPRCTSSQFFFSLSLFHFKARLDERERMLSDKCRQVDDLTQRLRESDRRLSQAITTARSDQARQLAETDHLARSGPSSLEEICQLRSALSEATHAREEQERRIRDLSVSRSCARLFKTYYHFVVCACLNYNIPVALERLHINNPC